MREEITSNFNGVDIAYNFHDNKWFYTSESGRRIERNSLKECIFSIPHSPPAPKEKKKPFTAFQAIRWSQYGHSTPSEVTVTSYDLDGKQVWVKDINGGRSKERLEDMVPDCPQTKAIIAEYERLDQEVEKMHKAQRDLRNGCPKLPPAPKE